MPSYCYQIEMQLAEKINGNLGRFEFLARWSHRSLTTAGWVLFKRGPRKPAHHPYHLIYPLFRISTHTPNAVEVWPHAQGRLCCPARHHFQATPTSLRPSPPSCRSHPTCWRLTAGGVLRRRWDLRSFLRYLSPHADGLTPGPCQVHMPFSSLATLAFSPNLEDRRVSPQCRVCPSIGLSQLCPSDDILRGCTIRLMLRPAVLAGTPDWVKPAFLRAVSVPCRGKFSPCVTTRIRPQPTYP